MMMSDNKKKAGMVIASFGDAMKPKPTVDGAEQDASAGLDAAAAEVLAAVEAKDASALKSALKSMISMCMDEYDAEPESKA